MALLRFFSMIIVLFFLAFTTSSILATYESKITVVQVNQLCSHAPDPTLCVNVLTHDPRTSHSDFIGVTGIALDLSNSGVKGTLAMLQRLVGQTPQGPVKQRYQSCVTDYTTALRALYDARGALGARNFQVVHDRAIDALFQVGNCEDEFEGSVERSPIVGMSKRNDGLIGIVVAATGFL